MNLRDFGAESRWRRQRTNLAEFCRSIAQQHALQLARQQITLHCDVADNLSYDLPQPLVRRILNAWIVEALNMMPQGGQLDITVIRTGKGLEIEVADSRDADLHETHDYWHRQIQIGDGAVIDSRSGVALQVEAARCPQGGIARTVVVPEGVAGEHPAAPSTWRKVA